MLEIFVFSEVLKQASWLGETCAVYHYRDKDQAEVDLVIEAGDGALIGIEVKASATVNAGDFKGLRKLADACGRDFRLGLVLYDGARAVPFGDRLVAAPIPCLWGDTILSRSTAGYATARIQGRKRMCFDESS